MARPPSFSYKRTTGALRSAMLVILFITAITVWADLQLPLKNWLKNMFGHHWVGKGILSAALFVLGVFLFSRPADERQIQRQTTMLVVSAVIGAVILVIFFLYESFLK